jgi:hypothetical protein
MFVPVCRLVVYAMVIICSQFGDKSEPRRAHGPPLNERMLRSSSGRLVSPQPKDQPNCMKNRLLEPNFWSAPREPEMKGGINTLDPNAL